MSVSSRARSWLPWLLALLGAVALAFGLPLLLGISQAGQAQAATREIERAIRQGDAPAAAESLRDLDRHLAAAQRWLAGAPVAWLRSAPVVGDSVAASGVVVTSLRSITGPLVPAVTALLEAGDATVEAFAESLAAQRDGLVQAARAARDGANTVRGIDRGTLVGPAAPVVAEAGERMQRAAEGLADLAAAAVVVPDLLGSGGQTQWLLAPAQPAEARGSGAGFFGAFGTMRSENGAIALVESRPNNEVFAQAVDLGALPAEFADLWGQSASYIWGHNLTRHFPYAAQLLAASTGTDPEYVVALDPRVVAGLLRLTGPVTASGVTIDQGNAEAYLTSGIYRQFPDGDTKDQVALDLMAAVLAELQRIEVRPAELVAALSAPLSQQRLVVWSSDEAKQAVISESGLAGAVPTEPLTLTAALNNAGGNKLDAYVRSTAEVSLAGCGDRQTGSVAIALAMDPVPTDLPGYVVNTIRGPGEYGGTRMLVHIYGPPGAVLDEFAVNDAPAPRVTGTERGRPVWGTQVDLAPGRPVTVRATFSGDFPDEQLSFSAQPMIHDTEVALRDTRQCR